MNQLEKINVPGINEPLYYRPGTTDFHTFNQIFNENEYEVKGLTFTPEVIIDCGANVGYTSVYYANKFCNAKIISVEPDKSNFNILKLNTAPYKNIKTVNSGIWDKDCYLKVKDIGNGEWGLIVEESTEQEAGSFRAETILSLIETFEISEIDILKIDIEGAEKELFTNGYDLWLNKVKIIQIELHDRIKQGCSESFYNATYPYNFNKYVQGESVILYKEGTIERF